MNQHPKQFDNVQTVPAQTNPTYDSTGMKGILTRY